MLRSSVSVPVPPHVADGRNSLGIWRAGEFLLNKFVAYSRQGMVLQLVGWARGCYSAC